MKIRERVRSFFRSLGSDPIPEPVPPMLVRPEVGWRSGTSPPSAPRRVTVRLEILEGDRVCISTGEMVFQTGQSIRVVRTVTPGQDATAFSVEGVGG